MIALTPEQEVYWGNVGYGLLGSGRQIRQAVVGIPQAVGGKTRNVLAYAEPLIPNNSPSSPSSSTNASGGKGWIIAGFILLLLMMEK